MIIKLKHFLCSILDQEFVIYLREKVVLAFLTIFDMGFFERSFCLGGRGALCFYCSYDHEIWDRYISLNVFYTVVTKSF